MGGKKIFIWFILTTITTILLAISVIISKGIDTCILLLAEGLFIDNIKEFIKAIKKTNDEYTIETKEK